ncbi:MAG: hypothetical protein K2K60_02540 [Clostridia bacterium]|nr:hypothetical protein [Clostridia bacterium]
MNKLKLSSRMHVMIIVSAIVIAIGLAVGLICEFVADGYFNYGNEYKSYQSVTVKYSSIYFNEDTVKEVCDKEFKSADISYYASVCGEDKDYYEFRFSNGTKTEKIQSAIEAIDLKISDGTEHPLNFATYHKVNAKLGGGYSLKFGAIALAASVAFQFIYFVIRYRLTAAFAALLADVHNIGIFLSLLAITRVPVGSSVFAFATLTVLMTMIGCSFLFGRVRKNNKDEAFAKLGANEISDTSAQESLFSVCVSAVAFAAVACLALLFLSISALSVAGVLASVFGALFAAIATVYGTSFFIPAVYSRFKRIGDNFLQKHGKKSKK